MKLKNILCPALALSLVVGGVVGCATEKNQEKLQAEARISRAEAERTALAKVPDGTIKEGELEKEKGKLIWSFDIATPGTTDIKEVQVDAITGQLASVETETADEAREKEKESKGKKHEKENDDEKDEKK
jgi:hypothetical protein